MDANNNMIRFIDSGYRELFKIPDGGSIRITYPPGDEREPVTRACKFLDETHFETLGRGGDIYHICQFAEIMERIGARYEPEIQLRNAEIVPFAPGEEKYCTYNRENGNTCVGHISGEFGQQGDRFFSSWYNHKTKSEADWNDVTPEFQTELYSAMYALRQDVLKDHNSMMAFCQSHPEAKLYDKDDLKNYGFKLDTENRLYFILCIAEQYSRNSRFIVYAYNKPMPVLEQARPAISEIQPGLAAEINMYGRNDKEDSLSVGYLRGDFGSNGKEFWHNWFDIDSGRNTPEFKAEFQNVVETLRQDILKDHKSSTDYCYKYPEAKLPDGDGYRFGFKLETESRQYFVRCTTLLKDYFYVFAYDKAAPELEQEKPSVLKQIRDAQKTPKPPRKAKAPDKKKDGAEL